MVVIIVRLAKYAMLPSLSGHRAQSSPPRYLKWRWKRKHWWPRRRCHYLRDLLSHTPKREIDSARIICVSTSSILAMKSVAYASSQGWPTNCRINLTHLSMATAFYIQPSLSTLQPRWQNEWHEGLEWKSRYLTICQNGGERWRKGLGD